MTDDDPERRVRDLERGLADTAAATEYPSTTASPDRQGTGMRLGWILLGLLVLGLVIGGGAMLAERISSSGKPVAGRPTTAEVAGGGGSFTAAPPPLQAPPAPGTESQIPHTYVPPPDSGEISVSGVGKAERYDCRSRDVSISGVDNKVILTGHCARVDVSGVGNTVTIEESGTIVVSGFNNVVTYRDGNPEVTKSGMNNTLERG